MYTTPVLHPSCAVVLTRHHDAMALAICVMSSSSLPDWHGHTFVVMLCVMSRQPLLLLPSLLCHGLVIIAIHCLLLSLSHHPISHLVVVVVMVANLDLILIPLIPLVVVDVVSLWY